MGMGGVLGPRLTWLIPYTRGCLPPADVKKMPLGKLSKQQIAKGFEALEAIEKALQKPSQPYGQLEELSSHFYTVIPHNFGRARPPSINTQEVLQAKKDMLLVRVLSMGGMTSPASPTGLQPGLCAAK